MARRAGVAHAERERAEERQYERSLGRIEEARERLAGGRGPARGGAAVPGPSGSVSAPHRGPSRPSTAKGSERLLDASEAQPPGVQGGMRRGRSRGARRAPQLAITAARLAPPDDIGGSWGRGRATERKPRAGSAGGELIEGYRQEHGITDRDRAWGSNRSSGSEAGRRPSGGRHRLAEIRRQLGHELVLEHAIELGHSLGR